MVQLDRRRGTVGGRGCDAIVSAHWEIANQRGKLLAGPDQWNNQRHWQFRAGHRGSDEFDVVNLKKGLDRDGHRSNVRRRRRPRATD